MHRHSKIFPAVTRTRAERISGFDDGLDQIRAEIIRLSGYLPTDDPLRIAIACAPRYRQEAP